MRRYSLSFFISQSLKGLFRNGVMSVASITILMSCLAVIGSFSLLVFNIDYNLEKVGVLNQIVVFCDVNCTEEQVQEIGRQIRLLDNVEEDGVVEISKEQALAEERQKYAEYTDLFSEMDKDGMNPYPDSFVINYKDNSKVSTLQYELEQIEGISKIKCRADLAATIESLKNGIIIIFSWFLVILFFVSIFVIINTIKLAVFSRRQEISIMRYVGATKGFITLPFVFEGALIGLVASGLAYLVQWYTYSYITKMVHQNYQIFSIIAFDSVKYYILGGFVLIGVMTGIIGSCISLSKYLKA